MREQKANYCYMEKPHIVTLVTSNQVGHGQHERITERAGIVRQRADKTDR